MHPICLYADGKEAGEGKSLSGDRKRVGFVTGSRADYGIMRNFLKLLDEDGNILLDIITTGALLSEKYGRQVELIYKDGFHVSASNMPRVSP